MNKETLACKEAKRISGVSCFNVVGYEEKIRLNQYATVYVFNDRSEIIVSDKHGEKICFMNMINAGFNK